MALDLKRNVSCTVHRARTGAQHFVPAVAIEEGKCGVKSRVISKCVSKKREKKVKVLSLILLCKTIRFSSGLLSFRLRCEMALVRARCVKAFRRVIMPLLAIMIQQPELVPKSKLWSCWLVTQNAHLTWIAPLIGPLGARGNGRELITSRIKTGSMNESIIYASFFFLPRKCNKEWA